jgi:hypothetical protein
MVREQELMRTELTTVKNKALLQNLELSYESEE